MITERRRFNTSERIALYLAADGQCENCGVELEPGWHADHIHPWSKGGPTDVTNGQAFCSDCNLKKGARVAITLFPKQEEAVATILRLDFKSVLIAAAPRFGKSFVMARAISDFRKLYQAPVVVVVHSRAQCAQFAEDALKFGVDLDPSFEDHLGRLKGGYDGVVVTYQSIVANPQRYRKLAGASGLLVVDEVHHVAEARAYGAAMKQAFSGTANRLFFTGTPYRTDKTPIWGMEGKYDDDGQIVADFTYTIKDALRDRLVGKSRVRPLRFHMFDGVGEFVDTGGIQHRVEFSSVDDETRSRVLYSAFRGGLDIDMLTMAHESPGKKIVWGDGVKQVREVIPRLIRRVDPKGRITTVMGDDADAAEKLLNAKSDDTVWLVVDGLASEGYTNEALHFGVVLSAKATRLLCTQRWFRVGSGAEGEDKYFRGTIILPKVEPFITYALEIEEFYRQACEEAGKPTERPPREPTDEEDSKAELLTGESRGYSDTFSSGKERGADEFLDAVEIAAHAPGYGPEEVLDIMDAIKARESAPDAPVSAPRPKYVREKVHRDALASKCSKLDRIAYGSAWGSANMDLRRFYKQRARCTEEELAEMVELVDEALAHSITIAEARELLRV